ncbi:glycosyl hydrolase family 95 catalytic domain-containing protein [Paenibacillus gallinarum]|uniref:Glycoside hydrolase N-terminal domain-containing protein n=1 Tax=Paenibacillus gallinarum TaxID=2762232 RepID=A0ABR8T186_9BACL|nr:glycoside hydrolase N-terminal domain-containing protein [Paenibacillus gallinarum]MBD7969532.1 glycoside hydrolase N-terminal domain-containing protein [Paenibacillus gallinarum]
MKEKNGQSDIRPDRNRLRLRYPASWWQGMWREALPSGNGKIGASVQGGIQEETVLLQHSELWHWGQKDELPDVSYTLPETRLMMQEERFLEASWHLTRTLQEKGYASKLSSRFPLAALTVSMQSDSAFRKYRRELDMDTGEVHVRWEEKKRCYSRSLFVSRADDCVVYELEGRELKEADTDQETGISAISKPLLTGTIALQFHLGDRVREDEEFMALKSSITVQVDDDYLFYGGQNDDGQDFGAVLRLIRVDEEPVQEGIPADRNSSSLGNIDTNLDDAQRGKQEKFRNSGKLHFQSSGKLLILVKMFSSGKREQEWARLKQKLALFGTSYGELLAKHTELHQHLFRSAELDLDDAADDSLSNEELLMGAYEGEAPMGLVRKLWAYGRYLFISGTSEHSKSPFGLYGLWGGDYRLIWGHNMANENVQMMYWHTAVGGLSHLNLSLFRYYNSLMDDFRNNATKLYGCRGIYIPAGTTPGMGVPNQIVPVIMNWTGAAGWLARHYYEHYRYTADMEFLLNDALPFMREALRFYEDFLVLGADGQYIIYPSVSPENTPENFMPQDGQQLAHPMPTAINATMDIAIIKELLQNVIEASRNAGIHSGEIPHWERMLERLPSYIVNKEGAVKEWLHPAFEDRQNHRHLSHLYPVFPGQEVYREEQPELFEAFEKAVHQRKLGAQSGWSLAHMSSIYARLGDGARALECLDILARSCLLNNGFTLHNDWRNMGVCMSMPAAPVQLDANLGWVNAVQEMLLYVSPQWIKLLPALPARWIRGSIHGWCIPGGNLSLTWDQAAGSFRAELIASRQITTKLQLPDWITACKVHSRNGTVLRATMAGNYEINLRSGEKLVFEQIAPET